jgi:hypothetical protein
MLFRLKGVLQGRKGCKEGRKEGVQGRDVRKQYKGGV